MSITQRTRAFGKQQATSHLELSSLAYKSADHAVSPCTQYPPKNDAIRCRMDQNERCPFSRPFLTYVEHLAPDRHCFLLTFCNGYWDAIPVLSFSGSVPKGRGHGKEKGKSTMVAPDPQGQPAGEHQKCATSYFRNYTTRPTRLGVGGRKEGCELLARLERCE